MAPAKKTSANHRHERHDSEIVAYLCGLLNDDDELQSLSKGGAPLLSEMIDDVMGQGHTAYCVDIDLHKPCMYE